MPDRLTIYPPAEQLHSRTEYDIRIGLLGENREEFQDGVQRRRQVGMPVADIGVVF